MPAKTPPTYHDSTLALLRDPYGMISSRCDQLQTDVFATRLFLRKVICLRGAEAARTFYDEDLFQRKGATPGRLQGTLFGRDGVQGLDDAAHDRRKAMFMSLLTPEHAAQIVRQCDERWNERLRYWSQQQEITLYEQTNELLTWAACRWAGVPLPEADVPRRTRELVALFQYAGSWGPKHWWSRGMRKQTNHWIEQLIDQIRAHPDEFGDETPAKIVALHRDPDGNLLSTHDAAVEVINLIRPIVAISVYLVLAAVALHEHAGPRDRVRDDDEFAEPFVQEVRRYYPFFPFVGAITRRQFEWRDYRFPAGRRVLLDLYGTNHDRQTFDEPNVFRPERFAGDNATPFNFIPQGGGDAHHTHRCPGEPTTIAVMKWFVKKLTRGVDFDVPPQDLRLQRRRLPALPKSRFRMCDLRAAG